MRCRVWVLSVRVLLLAALALSAAMATFVIASRIRHPHDLEWMTGSVLDHVERVRQGRPLYTAPSGDWIPFLYPPLYYWVGAALGGSAFACRLLALAASIMQGAMAWKAARLLEATRLWSAVAVLIFVAAFPFVGFWYDVERSDTLYGAIVLAASVVLLGARSVRGYVAAGALFALAAVAKQQAVFYLAGAVAGLLVGMRAADQPVRRRDVVAFVAAAGVPLIVLVGIAFAGDGWAAYYLLQMPRAHGILKSLVPVVAQRDVPLGFLLVGVTVVAAVTAVPRAVRGTLKRAEAIAAATLVTGFGGAIASRLHIGGWINVLIPWTTCAAVAVGVLASRAEKRWSSRPWVATAVALTIIGQLFVWRYDPRRVIPQAGTVADEQRLLSQVAELERRGEVLLPTRGHLTRERHAHISALADVARVEGHSPPDLVRALRERRYAAVVDDAHEQAALPDSWPPTTLEEIGDLAVPLLASYFVGRRLDYGRDWLPLPSPATPRWVYFPRRLPLDATVTELRRRQRAEMQLAERRAEAIARGEPAPFAEADIEVLAAAKVAPGP